jgi:transposase InsO family protein
MSRTGNCYDNRIAERFSATFKSELFDRVRWPTRQVARQAVFGWLDVFQSVRRRHSAFGYVSPGADEERHSQTAAA